jgi:hypothetical protein
MTFLDHWNETLELKLEMFIYSRVNSYRMFIALVLLCVFLLIVYKTGIFLCMFCFWRDLLLSDWQLVYLYQDYTSCIVYSNEPPQPKMKIKKCKFCYVTLKYLQC